MKTFADLIRETNTASGRTAYRLARDSGVNSAIVGRFLKGERGVSLTTAEKLCRALGLELRLTDASTAPEGERRRTAKKGG